MWIHSGGGKKPRRRKEGPKKISVCLFSACASGRSVSLEETSTKPSRVVLRTPKLYSRLSGGYIVDESELDGNPLNSFCGELEDVVKSTEANKNGCIFVVGPRNSDRLRFVFGTRERPGLLYAIVFHLLGYAEHPVVSRENTPQFEETEIISVVDRSETMRLIDSLNVSSIPFDGEGKEKCSHCTEMDDKNDFREVRLGARYFSSGKVSELMDLPGSGRFMSMKTESAAYCALRVLRGCFKKIFSTNPGHLLLNFFVRSKDFPSHWNRLTFCVLNKESHRLSRAHNVAVSSTVSALIELGRRGSEFVRWRASPLTHELKEALSCGTRVAVCGCLDPSHNSDSEVRQLISLCSSIFSAQDRDKMERVEKERLKKEAMMNSIMETEDAFVHRVSHQLGEMRTFLKTRREESSEVHESHVREDVSSNSQKPIPSFMDMVSHFRSLRSKK